MLGSGCIGGEDRRAVSFSGLARAQTIPSQQPKA